MQCCLRPSRLALLAAALQGRQCSDWVERNFFSRRDAGEHFHVLAPCAFSQAQLAKADVAVRASLQPVRPHEAALEPSGRRAPLEVVPVTR